MFEIFPWKITSTFIQLSKYQANNFSISISCNTAKQMTTHQLLVLSWLQFGLLACNMLSQYLTIRQARTVHKKSLSDCISSNICLRCMFNREWAVRKLFELYLFLLSISHMCDCSKCQLIYIFYLGLPSYWDDIYNTIWLMKYGNFR